MAEYIPSAPINDEAKKRNQNLPGMGGIFNTTNCGLYHYAANNPVRYTDPDGRSVWGATKEFAKGAWDGLVGDVDNVKNAVCHPIQTIKGSYTEIKTSIGILLNDPVDTVTQFIDDIEQNINDFIGSTPEEKAYALGGITEKIVVAVAISKGAKAIGNKICSIEVNGNTAKDLNRPYIRKSTREAVEKMAQKNVNGQFIDPNTGKPITGKYDLGHKFGHEFRREKALAQKQGLSQKQFNDRMNNPNLYQIEDIHSNRSHKYELPD